MSLYLIDTSCMVAAVCSWHQHHAVTRAELQRLQQARWRPVIAGHSLAEAYSVLTRLPTPRRLSPSDALALVSQNWRQARVAVLAPPDYWRLLQACKAEGIAGGQLYDALIAACGRRAGARAILTLNPDHFRRVGVSAELLVPGRL